MMMKSEKHIEITWDDGRKTVEAYDPGKMDADDCFNMMLHLIGFYKGEPMTFVEMD